MSTKTIKKYFCDGCGVEATEGAFNTLPWCENPITYVVRQRRHTDSDLEMDLCSTCQNALAKAIDQMHGVTEEEVEDVVDEDAEMESIHCEETAVYRLTQLEDLWSEISNSVEIKGSIEEGLVAMAREINKHRYPYA